MSSPQLTIRRLVPADADAFMALRREALTREPLSFGASPEDDRALDPNFVHRALDAAASDPTYGAFAPALVGSVGLYRPDEKKAAHKAQLWGLYVTPDDRGCGIGARLVSAALQFARQHASIQQVHLSVSTRSTAAVHLYERLGFKTWGTEPNALCHDRTCVDEHHMVLVL